MSMFVLESQYRLPKRLVLRRMLYEPQIEWLGLQHWQE